MALPQNENTTQTLKAVLEPMILGKQLPPLRCNCGCVNFGPTIAIEISPGGKHPYEGHETQWWFWTVQMAPISRPQREYSYSIGLSSFLSEEELDKLFEQYFPSGSRPPES